MCMYKVQHVYIKYNQLQIQTYINIYFKSMYTYLNIHTEMNNKFFFIERNTGTEVLRGHWFGEWALESQLPKMHKIGKRSVPLRIVVKRQTIYAKCLGAFLVTWQDL